MKTGQRFGLKKFLRSFPVIIWMQTFCLGYVFVAHRELCTFKDKFKKNNTALLDVPVCCTKYIQAPDVYWNANFKEQMSWKNYSTDVIKSLSTGCASPLFILMVVKMKFTT